MYLTHKNNLRLLLIHIVVFVICYESFLFGAIPQTGMRFVWFTENIPVFNFDQYKHVCFTRFNPKKQLFIDYFFISMRGNNACIGSEWSLTHVGIIRNVIFEISDYKRIIWIKLYPRQYLCIKSGSFPSIRKNNLIREFFSSFNRLRNWLIKSNPCTFLQLGITSHSQQRGEVDTEKSEQNQKAQFLSQTHIFLCNILKWVLCAFNCLLLWFGLYFFWIGDFGLRRGYRFRLLAFGGFSCFALGFLLSHYTYNLLFILSAL